MRRITMAPVPMDIGDRGVIRTGRGDPPEAMAPMRLSPIPSG